MKGIFQEDSLSMLLFIFLVNPLSFSLHKRMEGYTCGKRKNHNAKRNFFVDDLKIYTNSKNTDKKKRKKQLDLQLCS